MFPETQVFPGKQQRMIAGADQQVWISMQARDKLYFKSSHLGVGYQKVKLFS